MMISQVFARVGASLELSNFVYNHLPHPKVATDLNPLGNLFITKSLKKFVTL